jgi:hypothetical protein
MTADEAILGLEIVAQLRSIPIPPLTEQDVERLLELLMDDPGMGDPLPLVDAYADPSCFAVSSRRAGPWAAGTRR